MQKNIKVILKDKIDISIFDKSFYKDILEKIKSLKCSK